MQTFLVVLAVMLIVVALMAVGVLFGRRPLQGSCGGLANLGTDGTCGVCGRKADESCGRVLRGDRSRAAYDPFAEPGRPSGR